MQHLDWEALGSAIKSYTKFKQKKIIQLLYDCQNDGEQKAKFGMRQNECLACRLHENNIHYLTCEDSKMVIKWTNCLHAFGKEQQRAKTYPGIISASKQVLLQGCHITSESLTEQKTLTDISLAQAIQM